MKEETIKKYIKNDVFSFSFFDSLPSTNTFLKDNAEKTKEFSVVVSESQSAGRGRSGHTFYSPNGSGLYFSLLIRPSLAPEDAALVTCLSAVAVCEATELVTGKKCLIKWVNDVFSGGKKVCGILTEGIFGTDGKLSGIVLGVGINVKNGGFPEEIKEIAGALYDKDEILPENVKEKLLSSFLDRFYFHYTHGITSNGKNTFFEEYRARSFVIGKNAVAVSTENERKCRVLSLNPDCTLTVGYENGEKAVVSSGEIRIKTIPFR